MLGLESHLKTLTAAHDEAIAFHELVHQVMASPTCHNFTPFAKGDKVWLEARNLKCLVANLKFTLKCKGPFTITKILSPIIYQL